MVERMMPIPELELKELMEMERGEPAQNIHRHHRLSSCTHARQKWDLSLNYRTHTHPHKHKTSENIKNIIK